MLMVEMAESVLVEENDRAADAVAELREHGVRIAIDDFGAGHCSLSYLQRHPVDMIKIDRAFIDELGRDPLGNTLARTILQMASSLDIRTVAEGIETTVQLRELRRLGCDLGQGYLLSRPLETDALARRFGGAPSGRERHRLTADRRPWARPDDATDTVRLSCCGSAWCVRTACRYPAACRRRCSGWPASCAARDTRRGCSDRVTVHRPARSSPRSATACRRPPTDRSHRWRPTRRPRCARSAP